jgi:phosphatidylethanolamine/phosphatidyl-N-methylethanolamine N-methyltransferase
MKFSKTASGLRERGHAPIPLERINSHGTFRMAQIPTQGMRPCAFMNRLFQFEKNRLKALIETVSFNPRQFGLRTCYMRPLQSDSRGFARKAFSNLSTIGAIAPSSPHLAAAMVEALGDARGRHVLEIGPGTGAITRHINDLQGLKSLTLIENDQHFAEQLVQEFPRATVVNADALDYLNKVKGRAFQNRLVVSGLPLLNFPKDWRNVLACAVREVIGTQGCLVQFTYGLGDPLSEQTYLKGKRVDFVLRNAPPAFVWRYTAV